MWKLVLFIVIVYSLTVNPIEGCHPKEKCREYHYQSFTDHSKFITDFRDLRKLNNLALIGTHDSLTSGIVQHRTQDLDLADQLVYGIRVFQFGLRAEKNKFAVYKVSKYLNMLFDRVLEIITKFLKKNPGEFVILVLHREYSSAKDEPTNICQILEYYLLAYNRLVKTWSLNDTIDMHRGKMLLATIGDKSFGHCVKDLALECRLSSHLRVSIFGEPQIQAKEREVRALQVASFYENYTCFISFLSGDYMDSTLEMAVKGTKECDEPINHFMARHFDNSHRGLIILIVDFPTHNLIQQVLFSNTIDPLKSIEEKIEENMIDNEI